MLSMLLIGKRVKMNMVVADGGVTMFVVVIEGSSRHGLAQTAGFKRVDRRRAIALDQGLNPLSHLWIPLRKLL